MAAGLAWSARRVLGRCSRAETAQACQAPASTAGCQGTDLQAHSAPRALAGERALLASLAACLSSRRRWTSACRRRSPIPAEWHLQWQWLRQPQATRCSACLLRRMGRHTHRRPLLLHRAAGERQLWRLFQAWARRAAMHPTGRPEVCRQVRCPRCGNGQGIRSIRFVHVATPSLQMHPSAISVVQDDLQWPLEDHVTC